MSRNRILTDARAALGRAAGQAPPPLPPPRITIPEVDLETRVERLLANAAALATKTWRAPSPDAAREYVAGVLSGRAAIASNAPYLSECGIASLPCVRTGVSSREELQEICAGIPIGITSADYALADTGSLVMLSTPQEARMISLLPPVHIAVLPAGKVLTGLDEFLALVPKPAGISSSWLLITGPSRTADIEQILVRGVHGPGELHIVVVDQPGL